MRRLILQTSVSIDGYVAALDGSHPWGEGSEDEAFKRWILDSVWAADAHLMGRVTYEEMAEVASPFVVFERDGVSSVAGSAAPR